MGDLNRTALYSKHVELSAKMVEFGGWEMPLLYPTGIVAEHLATRRTAGLFDISHMGRLVIRGAGAVPFLQHVLTNNAAALDVGEGHYTLISTETGGAVDDAYLYRFVGDEFLLVVNAANREKDLAHLDSLLTGFRDAQVSDQTAEIAMFSLQGPLSRDILLGVIETGFLPEPKRNELSVVQIAGAEVRVSRTGYTGEPLCFELFTRREDAAKLWDVFVGAGATPVGLGARDTLRLEAGLPLYGNELGVDPDGKEIPAFACASARPSVSFSPLKGDYAGRAALLRQREAYSRILNRDYSSRADLPRILQPVALTGPGVARADAKVFKGPKHVGYLTSGTMAPYWKFEGDGLRSVVTDQHELRAICLAYVDCDVLEDDELTVEARGRALPAVVVPCHLRSEAPPYARPIICGYQPAEQPLSVGGASTKVRRLLDMAVANTTWRQRECINLIPSETTPSPMVRRLSVMDPAFRYEEHKQVKAFYDAEVFYYQGVDFIAEVERLLDEELRKFLGCAEVEARVTSGLMANAVIFSAMLDYLNRADRKAEPRRISYVMNNDIGKGGHLSAQPMGTLRDYVARDPRREKPAVVNFPVLADNPFQIDVPATFELIDQYKPELIIFGKSMVLHKEPVAEIRRFLDERGMNPVVMYDMAHVLGLIGPHFQQPFVEGADLVTGSTHKTFFGTQRGVIGSRYTEDEERYGLWEAILRRTFPGSVSNHHLGTLLGLLLASYEMNHFKDEYQPKVIANAKAFARALKDAGLSVAGDPGIGYTETHQVIVNVGYARGPEMARRLEANNIICNYQAAPSEESFSAAGSLRMGVSEMTRFGMEADDFRALAYLIADVVLRDANAKDEVKALRQRFLDLRFCFKEEDFGEAAQGLLSLF
jgi:aminomethyltransferase